MGTKRAKVSSKLEKATGSGETTRKENVTVSSNYEPTTEEIRLKAEQIYLERIARNEPGNSDDDWLMAEKLLKEKKK